MTELRRRMIEELRLRNYSPNTITVYIRCVAQFAQHFRVSPDRLGPEHIRQYQLFLVQQKKVSWALFNQTVCALRFFYHYVLHRGWMILLAEPCALVVRSLLGLGWSGPPAAS
jgi:integrase/recombinase XerD